MLDKRYPLGSWTKTGIMVSNDPHYPLEIATNSEIRRVFILDRFGWHTFILIISMNGISATLCRLLGNHP